KTGAERAPAGAAVQRTKHATGALIAVTSHVDLVGIGRIESRDIEVAYGQTGERTPGDTAIIAAKEALRGPGQYGRVGTSRGCRRHCQRRDDGVSREVSFDYRPAPTQSFGLYQIPGAGGAIVRTGEQRERVGPGEDGHRRDAQRIEAKGMPCAVAIKRIAGWAGAAAIDHTGRSGVPGCCAPVEVQRVSAPLAVVTVMSNPAASVMGVSRTIRRLNLTRVPGKTE